MLIHRVKVRGQREGARAKGLTRVEPNKLEEMMLTIVIAATVFLFLTSAKEVMFSVLFGILLVIRISQTLLDICQ